MGWRAVGRAGGGQGGAGGRRRRGGGRGPQGALALALLLALAALAALAAGRSGVAAAAGPLGPFEQGTVVALRGTPHLWFADEQGLLHWGGDTRALTGREIRWERRTEVTLDELLTLPRGAPWLSAGLVQAGEPIYFVKWETGAPVPALLRVQSIGDLELFGIDGGNYNALVLERAVWEARTGFRVEALSRGELAAATGVRPAGPPGGGPPDVYSAGRYAVLLPRGSFEVPLNELAAPQVETPQGPMIGRMVGFGAVLPGGSQAYVMADYDLPEGLAPAQTMTPEDVAAFFALVRDGFTEMAYGQVLAERPVLLGAYPGQEFRARGQGRDGLATVRLYLVRGRLYVLVGIGPDGSESGAGDPAPPPEVAVFLDSFRLSA